MSGATIGWKVLGNRHVQRMRRSASRRQESFTAFLVDQLCRWSVTW
jgi:hypothetical protein